MDQFDKMLAKWQPTALSLFRFITGLLLFQYGVAKILGFPVVPMFAKIPPLIVVAGTLELVLGALLMIGLFTRLSAFILSGEMAFAYFMGHMFKTPAAPVFHPILNGGTAAILEFSQPRGAVFGAVYEFYSRRILPVIGGALTGSRDAYTYLPESIRKFPNADQLSDDMRRAGFGEVRYELLTGGAVALHLGKTNPR